MGKYVYLCFVKLTERGLEKGLDYFSETWMPKHVELCKEHDIKLLAAGSPFGTVEDVVFVYETDRPLAEFFEFRMKLANLGEKGLIAHTKTITVLRVLEND